MSKLLDQLSSALRARNYSVRTEQAYTGWVRRFVRFHGLRHPAEMGEAEVISFLSHLAVNRNVAANTQNQALQALVFLYRHVLNRPLGDITSAVRAKKPQKLPVVLDRNEIRSVLHELEGINKLIAAVLYGSGLRLMEALKLRVKDLDFEYQCIHVHDAKGAKDRIVTLPPSLHSPLRLQLDRAGQIHHGDLARGYGEVYLPYALAGKYRNAARQWPWQYVFPSSRLSEDPRSGRTSRHHVYPSSFQKALRRAVLGAGIKKPASSHTLRHYAEFRIIPSGVLV